MYKLLLLILKKIAIITFAISIKFEGLFPKSLNLIIFMFAVFFLFQNIILMEKGKTKLNIFRGFTFPNLTATTKKTNSHPGSVSVIFSRTTSRIDRKPKRFFTKLPTWRRWQQIIKTATSWDRRNQKPRDSKPFYGTLQRKNSAEETAVVGVSAIFNGQPDHPALQVHARH